MNKQRLIILLCLCSLIGIALIGGFQLGCIYTNYNYSQLKQMFSDDKISFDTEYENNINEDDDEDDLFAYNNLNIQFEDEDPLDE